MALLSGTKQIWIFLPGLTSEGCKWWRPLLRNLSYTLTFLKVLSNNASIASFPLTSLEWDELRSTSASLRYTLNYLHSSQRIFSLRSNIGEENVTFKLLVCTSQESIKIRTRGKERYRAREKEIQSRARAVSIMEISRQLYKGAS